jgi:hypothetical protein
VGSGLPDGLDSASWPRGFRRRCRFPPRVDRDPLPPGARMARPAGRARRRSSHASYLEQRWPYPGRISASGACELLERRRPYLGQPVRRSSTAWRRLVYFLLHSVMERVVQDGSSARQRRRRRLLDVVAPLARGCQLPEQAT